MFERILYSNGEYLPNGWDNPEGEVAANDTVPAATQVQQGVVLVADDRVTPIYLPAGASMVFDAALPEDLDDGNSLISSTFGTTTDYRSAYTAALLTDTPAVAAAVAGRTTPLRLSGQYTIYLPGGGPPKRSQRKGVFLDNVVRTAGSGPAYPGADSLVTVNPASKALTSPTAAAFYAANPPPGNVDGQDIAPNSVSANGSMSAQGDITAGGNIYGNGSGLTGNATDFRVSDAARADTADTLSGNSGVTASGGNITADTITAFVNLYTDGGISALSAISSGTDLSAGDNIVAGANITAGGFLSLGSYTVGTKPEVYDVPVNAIIFVSDAQGGANYFFNDGANWLDFSRTVLS